MPADLLRLIQRQRALVNKADADNLRRIAEAYGVMYSRLGGDVDALRLAIEALDNPTVAEVKRLPQYKRLMSHGETELNRFTNYLETTIGTVGLAAIGLGLSHSRDLVNAMAGGGFKGLAPNALSALLKYLDPDGPLYARLNLITNSTAEKVAQAIIDGVSSGLNPRVIASQIQDAFGGGLTDALRNTRTVQLWSYRDSARANYMASEVVTGWIWYAELDSDTCEACAAEHGTVHELDEQLTGHYNCRCAPVPFIEGVTPEVASGEDWYNGLSEAEQRSFLGPGKYEALTAGKFEFSQMAKRTDNEIYGTMTVAATLAELVSE
jgi:SPP1 gp7 family putative phage head morphogenesis protein